MPAGVYMAVFVGVFVPVGVIMVMWVGMPVLVSVLVGVRVNVSAYVRMSLCLLGAVFTAMFRRAFGVHAHKRFTTLAAAQAAP